MERNEVGVAIIGAGRIARAHARALETQARAHLSGVVDPDPVAAHELAAEFGAPLATQSLDTVLERPDVDAVVIAAPTSAHHEITLRAIAAGKHVMVEKPFASSLTEALDMVAAARRGGVLVAAAQVLRFMPAFEWAKESIGRGDLGTPLHVIERRLTHRTENFPWWAQLPNFLIGHWGSHSVDAVLDLLSEQATSVFCDAASVGHNRTVVDDCIVQLRLSGGARAAFHLSFASRLDVHDIVVIGEESTLEFTGYHSLRRNGVDLLRSTDAQTLETAFSAQMRNFIDAILGNVELRAPGASVLPACAAIDGAERSAASGTAWTISESYRLDDQAIPAGEG
jgi:predicted dehydrogenase